MRYDKPTAMRILLGEIEKVGWGGFTDPGGIVAQTQLINREIEGVRPSRMLNDTTRRNPHYLEALGKIAATQWVENPELRAKATQEEIVLAEKKRFEGRVMRDTFEEEFKKRWGGWPAYVGGRVVEAIANGDGRFFLDCAKYLRKTSLGNAVPAGRKAKAKVAALAFILDALQADRPIAVRHVREHLRESGFVTASGEPSVTQRAVREWLAQYCSGLEIRDTIPGRPRAAKKPKPKLVKKKTKKRGGQGWKRFHSEVSKGHSRFFRSRRNP